MEKMNSKLPYIPVEISTSAHPKVGRVIASRRELVKLKTSVAATECFCHIQYFSDRIAALIAFFLQYYLQYQDASRYRALIARLTRA